MMTLCRSSVVNARCQIELLTGDEPMPMDLIFSDNDIVEHCTSEEQRFVLWRDHWKPFSQSKSFFFTDADHDDLNTMLKKVELP